MPVQGRLKVRGNTLPNDAASAHILLTGAPERLEVSNNLFDNAGSIGVLYTAVAGMLNLLAIIDASHRAAAGEGSGASGGAGSSAGGAPAEAR